MSGPRFVLVSDVLSSGARRTCWPDRSGLAGETGAGDSWVAWRLLGSNNHELGRSAVVFPDPERALEDVGVLRLAVEDLTVGVHVDGSQAEWRWRLLLDGQPAAVSSRSYLRQRECHYSASMFRVALPKAALPVVPAPGARAVPRPAARVRPLPAPRAECA